jgi:hypothetical protein
MSRAVGRLVLAVSMLVWRTSPLVGQTVPPHDSAARADLADRLRGQARARVRFRDGHEVELLEPNLDGDSLRFTAVASAHGRPDSLLGQGARALALADILRVQVRKTAVAKGAILGFIVGGTALALRDRTGSAPTWDHNETLFFGMIGGVLGSVVGGVIGAPFRGWTTVYQAAPAAPRTCRSHPVESRARPSHCMFLRPLGLRMPGAGRGSS